MIVNGNLAQAGSERWLFEICKHINKEKFEVGVLCYKKYAKQNGTVNYSNYYYHKLKQLKVNLHALFPNTDDKPTYFTRGINKIRRKMYKITRNPGLITDSAIVNLFRNYDVICIVDFNYYRIIKNEIHQVPSEKVAISLLCHKFQFESDPYVWFDKDRKYNFIHFCPNQADELASSNIDVRANNLFRFPLAMDLSEYSLIFNPIIDNSVVISIFTRISKMKRIDVFIESFAKMSRTATAKLTLYIYGDVQDEDYYQELQRQIADYEITDAVRFMGHSSDMAESIKQDKINLYWGLSIGASVGFSSIEVGAMGIPSIYWSVDKSSDHARIADQTNGAIIAHNNINEFVGANLHYISDPELFAQLSAEQRNYFFTVHNIKENIEEFEAFVVSLKNALAVEAI